MDNTRIHPLSNNLQQLIDLYLFGGRPVNRNKTQEVVVLINHGYAVGFSPSHLQPLWAAYRVAGSSGDIGFDRPHLYYDDMRLDPEWRIGPETFGKHDGIGYHVGHLVPNEVINRQFGRLAQMETFFMSNMSPQRGSLNTGTWLKLENSIRKIEDTPDRDHVWAIAGPIFSEEPALIMRPNGKQVPIPKAYYYITIDPFRYPWNRPSNVNILCFIISQDAPSGTPLTDYLVELADIEAATNLSFFPRWRDPEADAEEEATELFPPQSKGDIFGPQHRLLDQL